jgi:2-amino-4-hydroxy-6-hydroxymethyldihydropteridine diphosphokinase
MTVVYLGLGSNIEDKKQHLRDALELIAGLGVICHLSRLYQTEPVGFRDQDWFLNLVAELDTDLSPDMLLSSIKSIERTLGRKKARKDGPRTIDIDLLFYGDLVVNSQTLVIPHPRLQDRLFVLQPLMDLNPDLRHPLLRKTIRELVSSRRWTDQVVPIEDGINSLDSHSAIIAGSSMRLCQVFVFDAAHFIPDYKGKCEQLHGHTYRLEVVIEEDKDGTLTFEATKKIVKDSIIEKLDHQLLNTFFKNPTAEIIVEWIVAELKGRLPLVSVRLWEGQGKWAEYIV